jgi:hypothetical protein
MPLRDCGGARAPLDRKLIIPDAVVRSGGGLSRIRGVVAPGVKSAVLH